MYSIRFFCTASHCHVPLLQCAGELPRSASSHFVMMQHHRSTATASTFWDITLCNVQLCGCCSAMCSASALVCSNVRIFLSICIWKPAYMGMWKFQKVFCCQVGYSSDISWRKGLLAKLTNNAVKFSRKMWQYIWVQKPSANIWRMPRDNVWMLQCS